MSKQARKAAEEIAAYLSMPIPLEPRGSRFSTDESKGIGILAAIIDKHFAREQSRGGDWVTVPREPTPEMQEAAEISDREYTKRVFGDFATVRQGPYDTYVTMIESSPTAPQQAAPLTDSEGILIANIERILREDSRDALARDFRTIISRLIPRTLTPADSALLSRVIGILHQRGIEADAKALQELVGRIGKERGE